MTLVKRLVKGAPLTAAEFDGNFEHVLANAGVIPPTFTAAVAVATIGDDDNAGTRRDLPKLTLASALAASSALITAGASAVLVHVLDGGAYTEADQIEVTAGVHVRFPAATFIGSVAVEAGGSFIGHRHFPGAAEATMVQHAGGSDGPAFYRTNICDGRGVAGSFEGVKNIRNVGGGGKNLFVQPGVLYVGASGIGIGDVSSGNAGHIHLDIPDLYLAGNGAVGILGSAQGQGASNIIGKIHHLLEIGGPTGAVGIRVNSANAVVRITAEHIMNLGSTNTGFDVSAGRLVLNCLEVNGTLTHTGGTVVRPSLVTTTL